MLWTIVMNSGLVHYFGALTFPMNIVVLSRDTKLYSIKRLVVACEIRGHNVRVINHIKCDIFIEKKNPQIIYGGESITDVDVLWHCGGPTVRNDESFYHH